MTYTVWILDVWGHGSDCKPYGCNGNCDGWTVNDRRKTSDTVEINEDDSDEEIVKILVNAGFLTGKCLTPKYLTIDGEYDQLLFVDRAEDGFPILQLEAI